MITSKFDLAPKNVSNYRYLAFFGVSFSLLFSVVGADGSYGSEVQSFAVWVPTVFLALFFLSFSHWTLRILFKKDSWFICFLESLLGSILFAPFAYFIDVFLLVDLGPYLSLAGILEEFSHVFLPILLSWVLIRTPGLIGLGILGGMKRDYRNKIRSAESNESSESYLGSFMEKVPKELGSDLIYIKAEKQYVNVVTSKGSTLLLCGFNQAIDSLPSNYGLKLHRSFWVARKHIHKIDKEARTVTLPNGLTLPISRRVLSDLKDQPQLTVEPPSTNPQLSGSLISKNDLNPSEFRSLFS